MPLPEKYHEYPLTFERGLIETVEESMLPPGAAARLVNYAPEASGNLRIRVPWQKGSTASAPATRKGMGIGHLALQRRPYKVQGASDDATGAAGATAVATWPATTVAGNLLILKVSVGLSVISGGLDVTDITATGWTLATSSFGTQEGTAIYYKANAASESGGVSVSFADFAANEESIFIEIEEWADCATSSPLDKVATATGTTETTLSSGTTALTDVPVGLAVSVIAQSDTTDNTFSSPTNGFTEALEAFVNSAATTDLNHVSHQLVYDTNVAKGHSVTVNNAGTTWKGCIATFKANNYSQTVGFYFVANNDTTEIDIYRVGRDDLAAGTWALLETVSGSPDVLPVSFTSGDNKLVYAHPSFTGVRYWSGLGSTPAVLANSPAGGRFVTFHKSRLFTGGTPNQPFRLHMSEPGDFETWTHSVDVNEGDGEAIEDTAPFEDGLVVAKQTSLWHYFGSGPENGVLVRFPIGGAAPGRTVTPTPYGCYVAGRKHVWVISGGSVDLVSPPVSMSYGITGNWMEGRFVNDVYYILDQGSGTVWALDFRMGGVWREETVSSPTTEGPANLYQQDDKLLYAPKNSTTSGLLQWRLMPGTTRGKDFDTLSETFEAWTPITWPEGPERKITPRYLFLRLRQHGAWAGTDSPFVVQLVCDGIEGPLHEIEPRAAEGVNFVRVDVGRDNDFKGVSGVQVRFSQTALSTETGLIEPELATLGYTYAEVK